MQPRPTEQAAAPVRPVAGGIVLLVRLTPKSALDRIEPLLPLESHFSARVRAAPEHGKANAALVRLIAEWLGVAPSRVKVKAGAASRLKQILVEGDTAALMALLRNRTATPATSSRTGTP